MSFVRFEILKTSQKKGFFFLCFFANIEKLFEKISDHI